VSVPRPTLEPQSIVAGDTAVWDKTFDNYPASEGWLLSYRLINTSNKYDITGAMVTNTGGTFNINVTAATTAAYGAGDYMWNAYVAKGAERYTVASGVLTIKPNISAATGGLDTRSTVKKTLDAIDSLISGRASADVAMYKSNGRELTKMSISDLSVDTDAARKLSLSQCRRLLGSGTSIDDANLARLRDELYKLAEVALEGFRHREKC